MQRVEQAFIVVVFAVSLFFVFIAFNEKPEGFGSIMLVGAILAGSAMISWFVRDRRRRPPDAE